MNKALKHRCGFFPSDTEPAIVLKPTNGAFDSPTALIPPEELERFAEWFEHFINNQWDKNFEADVASGRLDAVAKKADADFEAGHCTPL